MSRFAWPAGQDAEGETRSPAERRADALDDIVRFFLDHQREMVGGRHRPHVNVVVRPTRLDRHAAGPNADRTHLDGASAV